MNFLQILKKSSRLTLINGTGVLLNFLTVSYAANRFGADAYGRISFVLLWVSYAGLVRPGFFEGGQRQLINLIGQKESERSLLAQNAGFSAEVLWCILPAITLASASMILPDPIRRIAFALAPLLFFGQALTRMIGGLFLAHQELGDYTIGYLVRAIVQPPILIALIGVIGPLSLIVAPILAEWGVAAYYLVKAQKIGLKWRVDKQTAIELSKAGFPLSLAAVAYWLYRLAGPTSIAAVMTVASLGIYTFASRIIDQIIRFFGDFTNVLMPAIWTELSASGSAGHLLPHMSRINTYLVLLSCFGCNLVQAVSVILIPVFLPRFVSSVPLLEILSFNAVLLTISMTPGLILDSALVNKQRLHVGIWTLGLATNYALNFAILARGYGVRAIAWNDILVQIFVDALIYTAVHKYLFTSWRAVSRLYIPMGCLAMGCASIFAVLRAPFWNVAVDAADWKLAVLFALRCGFVVGAWVITCMYLRRSDRITPSEDASRRQTVAASTL